MTPAEDCAAFSSKLEQNLPYVQAMYSGEFKNQTILAFVEGKIFSWTSSEFKD